MKLRHFQVNQNDAEKVCFTVLLFTLLNLLFQAQQNKEQEKLAKSVDTILQNAVGRKMIPAAIIEIKKGNKILCRKAYGFAERNDDHKQARAFLPAPCNRG